MASDRPELVSRATRRAFRELATGTVLREIADIWQDEGFAPGPADPNVGGERRSLYQSYLDAVDWSDPHQVARALRVFESTVRGIEPAYVAGAYDLLRRDGYQVAEDGRISGGPRTVLREGSLASLNDPAAIRDNLDRIARALEHDDPAQAIGSAKELVESTAKVVLNELGGEVNDKDDLPKLVLDAELGLGVHPSQHSPGPDGSAAVKKILGGATSVTTGIAELRNRGYGTGHGKGQRRVGLSSRHAHLAVNAARTWCEFMLDTLADPDAPWRTNPQRLKVGPGSPPVVPPAIGVLRS